MFRAHFLVSCPWSPMLLSRHPRSFICFNPLLCPGRQWRMNNVPTRPSALRPQMLACLTGHSSITRSSYEQRALDAAARTGTGPRNQAHAPVHDGSADRAPTGVQRSAPTHWVIRRVVHECCACMAQCIFVYTTQHPLFLALVHSCAALYRPYGITHGLHASSIGWRVGCIN